MSNTNAYSLYQMMCLQKRQHHYHLTECDRNKGRFILNANTQTQMQLAMQGRRDVLLRSKMQLITQRKQSCILCISARVLCQLAYEISFCGSRQDRSHSWMADGCTLFGLFHFGFCRQQKETHSSSVEMFSGDEMYITRTLADPRVLMNVESVTAT